MRNYLSRFLHAFQEMQKAVQERGAVAPPKWVQLTAVVVPSVLFPLLLVSLSPTWVWNRGTFVMLAVFAAVVGLFAAMALGFTGGAVSSPDQDKRLLNWLRWLTLGLVVLFLVNVLLNHYA